MYDNIGKKIKIMAKVIFVIGLIISLIAGFIIIGISQQLVLISLLIFVVGPIFFWISTWLLYGFGELIDKTCDIERNTRGGQKKSKAQSEIDTDKIDKIERLRSQGLISEEEYQRAISKYQ